ncbi:MAG TPA: hypothetical protein VEF72_06030, partial [Mycobacterium sp.]|nr:hypothetical protein [Mycobacterium sp.]
MTASASNINTRTEKTMAAAPYPGGTRTGVAALYLSTRVSKSAGRGESWARRFGSHASKRACTSGPLKPNTFALNPTSHAAAALD